MKDRSNYVLMCFGIIAVIWLALLIAPCLNNGLLEIMQEIPNRINSPFNIELCENSLKAVLIFLCIYFLGIGIYVSTKRNYRRGVEYGSASWGNARQINKKYMQKPKYKNKILTQNVNIGFNTKKHRRNLNVLVVRRFRSRKNKRVCKAESYAM